MPSASMELAIAFGILAYGVVVYLFSAAVYIDVTNRVEMAIANIEKDETIFGWEEFEHAKAHVRALRHKLGIIQLSLVIGARNRGIPPLVVGLALLMWFFSKT